MAYAEVTVETGKHFRAPFVYKNQQGAGKSSNALTFRECNSEMNWIFMEFSSSYCIVICSILQIYTVLYLPFEEWNREREKAVHFIEAWELKSDASTFSQTDLPLQSCENHYHFIFLWAYQSVKTAIFSHFTKMLHVFICMYKIFLQIVQLLSFLRIWTWYLLLRKKNLSDQVPREIFSSWFCFTALMLSVPFLKN